MAVSVGIAAGLTALISFGLDSGSEVLAVAVVLWLLIALLVMVSVSVAQRRADRMLDNPLVGRAGVAGVAQRAVDGLLVCIGLNVACETAWADPVAAPV